MSWMDVCIGRLILHHSTVVLLRGESRGLGEHVADSSNGSFFGEGVFPAVGQAHLFRGEDLPACGFHDVLDRGKARLPHPVQVPEKEGRGCGLEQVLYGCDLCD